jgi:hypothetical protein
MMIVGLIALAMLFASCGGSTTLEETLTPWRSYSEAPTGTYDFINGSNKDVTVTVTEGAGTFREYSSTVKVSDPKKFTLAYDKTASFETDATTVKFTATATGKVKIASNINGTVYFRDDKD